MPILRKPLYVLLIFLIPFLAANCERTLSRSKAGDLIRKSPRLIELEKSNRLSFIEADVISLPTALTGPLERAGYIRRMDEYHVSLTEKGRTASRFWYRESVYSGRGIAWFPTIAKAELREVTGISQSGNRAQVEFTWVLVATPLGEELMRNGLNTIDTGLQKGISLLVLYDDGWRVEGVHREQGRH